MKLKKIALFFFYLLVALTVIFTAYATYVYLTNEPPIEEMELARKALATAKTKKAGKYASESLREAQRLYDWSMREWKSQNSKFFIFRDYSLARDLALKSMNKSGTAGNEAQNAKTKLKNSVEADLEKLRAQITKFEKYYKILPLGQATFKAFHRGKTRYLEAKIEYEKNDYQKSVQLVQKAKEGVSQAEKAAHMKLVDFYKNYPEWDRNTKLAYRLSKSGQTVILVDKIQATCMILKGGKEIKSFTAEFGKNWIGDKNYSGDKATPEGVYKILDKKSNGRTKYYKALLIDYPNGEDRERFQRMVRSGEISKRTKIGGLIEIHGDGGRGAHWTEGCIALTNKEMDVIYSHVSINTPVIIVGSREPLEAYLN